jgi:hypothetical protein
MKKSFVISLLVVTMLSIGLQTVVVGTVATSSGPSLVFSVAADQSEAANPVHPVQSDLSGYALAYIDHDEREITVAITGAAVIECATSVSAGLNLPPMTTIVTTTASVSSPRPAFSNSSGDSDGH